ncbi:MAG: ATP-binding protein [Cyanobacteria bacterium]|nr:ATP-binding protein [Cyanobacteriota bacterium]
MASPARPDLPPGTPLAAWRRRLGYGASTAGFTALALLLLQLLLAQRLEQQQRRQLANQVAGSVLLAELGLERFSPAALADLSGMGLAVGPRPPAAASPGQPAPLALRLQAEALRNDLCRRLSHCPLVWPTGPGSPGRGAWVELQSPLETVWLFAPMAPRHGWPPDPQLASLALVAGGLASLLLFLALEVQRPLRRLEGALAQVGLDSDLPQPPLAASGGTDAVRRLTQRFNAMLDRIEATGRERRTMLAGLAHDLRSPLTRLQLRLASSGPLAADERRRAEADLAALERITRQFLQFVGAESQEAPVLVPLEELVAEAANGVDQVQLDLEPMRRCVQPIALARAIANLLDNADTHGQPPLRLVLRSLGQEGFAIEVWDAGPGIAEADWERALMPFQRLDPARSGVGHSGLGLAIAERVAQAHGGSLERLAPPQGGFAVVLWGRSLGRP